VRIPWTHGYAERKSLPLHQNMPFCPFPPLRSIDPDPFLPFPASMVVESIPPPPAPSLSDRPTQKVAHDLFPNPLFLKRLRPPPGSQSSAIWTGPIEPPAAGDQDISDSIGLRRTPHGPGSFESFEPTGVASLPRAPFTPGSLPIIPRRFSSR